MVNIVFTVVSLAILVVAMITRSATNGSVNPLEKTNVLSATVEESPTPQPVVSTSPTPTVAPVVLETPTPIAPTSTPNVQSSVEMWLYTGAVTDKSVGSSSLSFTTRDSAKAVATWYKNKMNELGYNSKSVIQTQSNEKVLDKLSGSGSRGSVAIEISQDNASAPVKVVVNVDTSSSNGDINVSVNNSI